MRTDQSESTRRVAPRPNILFIMADQFRFDATDLNGGWVKTPNLDRIAHEGVNFTRCYTNSPICVPARVSMATGLYPHNTNVWSNIRHFLPKDVPTWTRAVKEAGYRTAVFGKTHLHSHSGGDLRDREDILRACGFDVVDEIPGPRACMRIMSHMTERWQRLGLLQPYIEDYRERFANKPHAVRPSVLPLEEYADVYVAGKSEDYLRSYRFEEPWFCWLSFGGPHEPWDTPEPYAGMYDPASMPAPILAEGGEYSRPRGHLDALLANRAADLQSAGRISNRDDAPVHHPELEPAEIAKMRANYAGNVTLIDEQIGKVLKTVEDRGEMDNTVVIFTSDHGEMNGDYGLIYKESFLDGAARVPLIVRTPLTAAGSSVGAAPGARPESRAAPSCPSPVEWFDVGPTLVELAGGFIDHRQHARSLVPVVHSSEHHAPRETGHRSEALCEIWGEHMVMDGTWKMAINLEGRPYMLFNLHEDPQERRNLAGREGYGEIETRLRLRILERIAESPINGGCY